MTKFQVFFLIFLWFLVIFQILQKNRKLSTYSGMVFLTVVTCFFQSKSIIFMVFMIYLGIAALLVFSEFQSLFTSF